MHRHQGKRPNGAAEVPAEERRHCRDSHREDQRPSRDWLEIAKTGRALSKIRREIREDERSKGREIGFTMLETELQKYGGNLKKLVKAGDIKAEAKRERLPT